MRFYLSFFCYSSTLKPHVMLGNLTVFAVKMKIASVYDLKIGSSSYMKFN